MSLGIGVIGCGSVFTGPYATMIDALLSRGRVHVSAVYDLDERKRRGAATRYDVDPALPGPAAVIADDDVDVVLVLTSMNEHGALAREALEAGKHVLVEKPMAVSLAECDKMIAVCEKNGAQMAVNHQMRFLEQYSIPRGLLESDVYGGMKLPTPITEPARMPYFLRNASAVGVSGARPNSFLRRAS